MPNIVRVLALVCLTAPLLAEQTDETQSEETPVPAALNFTMDSIDGQPVPLAKYQGKVVLMVNVASKCGLTKQYTQLQALHEKYAQQGLAILGFPANDFGSQEPGSNEEIKTFCTTKHKVAFDMFAKISVKGDDQCPLYKYLTSLDPTPGPASGGDITWNFEKFLLNRKGEVIARFAPRTSPDDAQVIQAVERELAEK